mmetsp:Transcript_29447/g.49913  ORF Transcript_29447/g.49913 Transcript_29447/m.49913 type:complete len:206 (+) Transcript_29447:58-675(+)
MSTDTKKKDLSYKLTVMGSGAVGKSALTIRMVTNDQFVADYDPTIEDSYRTSTIVDGEPTLLDILDTAGQEEFHSLADSWIRNAEAFMLVYAIDDKMSFDNVSLLREQIVRTKDSDDIPMVLIANKSDISDSERKVTTEEGRALAKEFNIPFFETSAKENTNCTAPFQQAVRYIKKSRKIDAEEPKLKKSRRGGRMKLKFLCPIL